MSIEYCSSILHSMNVINLLKCQLRERDDVCLWIESFANGREQGFCIRSGYSKGNKACIVTEARGSDSILLIPGDGSKDIDPCKNQVTREDVYFKNREYYESDQKAANRILEFFLGESS